MDTPEKSSEYVKRVLFGGGGSSKAGGAMAAPGPRPHRSESHSSAGSSAAGTVVSSGPETPKQATGTYLFDGYKKVFSIFWRKLLSSFQFHF